MKSLLLALACTISLNSVVRAQDARPTFKLDGNNLVLPAPIEFKSGSSTLLPSANAGLQHIKDYLQDKTYITLVRIEGHAGTQQLSEDRAVAICKWLTGNGIDCSRLLPVGFGSAKPVADGSTAAGVTANTRIVVTNATLRGRAIGGMPVDGGGNVAGDPCK